MQKLNSFRSEINKYITICSKICARENLGEAKVTVLDKDFTYSDILDKLKNIESKLDLLNTNDSVSYYLLGSEFEENVYSSTQNGNVTNNTENSLKKHFNELTNTTHNSNNPNQVFPNQATTPWEQVFTQNSDNYKALLENEFPFNDIKNPTGQIYKRFQSLLHILFWLEYKLNYILSKNNEILETVKETLLENNEFRHKLGPISSDQIDSYLSFLSNLNKINETIDKVESISNEGSQTLTEISSQSEEFNLLLLELKTVKADTDILIETNRSLSSKLTSNEISGTFSASSDYYNNSKKYKILGILGTGILLLVWSIYLFHSFDIDKMSSLQDKYLVLLMYAIPRIFVFGIFSWILKFLIIEYRKDAQTALDFKHREAISTVTPAFRKQVENKENQEKIVMDAFEILLETPKSENTDKIPKEDKLFLMTTLNSLTDNERKDIFSLLKKAIISKLDIEEIKNKDNGIKEESND